MAEYMCVCLCERWGERVRHRMSKCEKQRKRERDPERYRDREREPSSIKT